MSTTSSSRPSSRAESHSELGAEHLETGHGHPLVYSRDRLMAFAKSPLATMTKEVKDGLRERLPEIVMSRKQRKAADFRALQQQRAQTQVQAQGQPRPSVQRQRAQMQVQAQGQPRPPVQAQQVNNAQNTKSNHVESAQQHQAFTDTHHHQHHHQPLHKQPHIYSHTTQDHRQVTAVPRNSPPRPAGRSWWNAPKHTTDEMTWRRAPGPASISVA